MLAHTLRRAPAHFRAVLHRSRPMSSMNNGSSTARLRFRFRPALFASGGAVAGSLLYMGTEAKLREAPAEQRIDQLRLDARPLSELIRAYLVYTMCSIPPLVDWSPAILEFLTSIPGVRQLTEEFVRGTFFAQFVGGPTAEACADLLKRMWAENKGVLFAYSVEVDEHAAAGRSSGKKADSDEPAHMRVRHEMLHSIDIAATFDDTHATNLIPANGRRTWVAIKLSALVPDHEVLVKLSTYLVHTAKRNPYDPRIEFPGCPRTTDMDILKHSTSLPGLSSEDMVDIVSLYQDLRKICQRAQEKRVRIIFDAEHSWYQPAIDCITFALMREFNKLPAKASVADNHASPLVYATFQAYFRRTPAFLAQSLQDAQKGGYALGVKLVRGAYHEQEAAVHNLPGSPSISPESHPPVWTTKSDTDKCYNDCVRLLIQKISVDVKAKPIPSIGVLFGSHNWNSVRLILDELQRLGLAAPADTLSSERQIEGHEMPIERVLHLPDAVAERVTLGQLYGMSDSLTDYIIARTRSSVPFVIKYVPYGALSEVMPYLARRAIENKSVLGDGQAAMERDRAWMAIRKRIGFA